MRLTHTTWFYINNMLTVGGLTNPKKLFLKDDTSLYAVVVEICWQSCRSKGHFQVLFTKCNQRVKSLCGRREMMVLEGNAEKVSAVFINLHEL